MGTSLWDSMERGKLFVDLLPDFEKYQPPLTRLGPQNFYWSNFNFIFAFTSFCGAVTWIVISWDVKHRSRQEGTDGNFAKLSFQNQLETGKQMEMHFRSLISENKLRQPLVFWKTLVEVLEMFWQVSSALIWKWKVCFKSADMFAIDVFLLR